MTSAKQASLLALLGSRAGEAVSSDRLIESLWGSHPPTTARNTLQVHVSALRRLLGADAVRHDVDSYVLDPDRVTVDIVRFEQLTREGTRLHEQGRDADAVRVLRAALALWRGEPDHFVDSPWALGESRRLAELRLLATTTCLAAELALGRHLLVLDELAALCLAHPYHEELAAARMLALYRSGRQADALAAYEQVRRDLAEDLGMDPGTTLRDLHQHVLRQDPVLDVPVEVRALQRPWDRSVDSLATGAVIGRESILRSTGDRVRPGVLVTLVGPSGIGKTRLATELARHAQHAFAQGAVIVTDAAALVDQLARHLGLPPDTDDAQLHRALATAELLVVVDDVVPGSPTVATLGGLVDAGGACWLATAPRPLGVRGEDLVPVPPLPARAGDEVGAGTELLLLRARQAGAELTDEPDAARLAAEVVELLDGVPLAIELVAPDAVLGLASLATRLRTTRREGAHPVELSLDTSLDRLDQTETAVMTFLLVCDAPADLELLCAAAIPGGGAGDVARAAAALVRDGLVRRQPGTHGQQMFDLADIVASQMRRRVGPAALDACARRVVDAVVALPGPRFYLPAALRTAAQSRRMMALLPLIGNALALARTQGSSASWMAILRRIHELEMANRGIAPSGERLSSPWPLEELSPGDRTDLLILLAFDHAESGRVDMAIECLSTAERLAEHDHDHGRLSAVHSSYFFFQGQGLVDAGDGPLRSRLALHHAELADEPEAMAGVLALRHEVPEGPALLERGIRFSREHGLVGEELLALANLTDLSLESGDPDTALRLALEAGALASDLHHPYMATAMRGSAEAARAISGSGRSMAHLARLLERAWPHDLWTVSDALMKLAAASRHRDDTAVAARCLGAYEAVLQWAMMPAPVPDQRMRQTWLHDVEPDRPQTSVEEAPGGLVAYFAGPSEGDTHAVGDITSAPSTGGRPAPGRPR